MAFKGVLSFIVIRFRLYKILPDRLVGWLISNKPTSEDVTWAKKEIEKRN